MQDEFALWYPAKDHGDECPCEHCNTTNLENALRLAQASKLLKEAADNLPIRHKRLRSSIYRFLRDGTKTWKQHMAQKEALNAAAQPAEDQILPVVSKHGPLGHDDDGS